MTASLLTLGCSAPFATIAPLTDPRAEPLGIAEGTACGSMLIYASAYNFIPILLNQRYERAYSKAVRSVPGATEVRDVVASEFWFFWGLGRTFCTTIRGEAVR